MTGDANQSLTMHHVGIDVDDLDASIAFYSRALDLETSYEFDIPEMALRGVFLTSTAGWTIELFKRDRGAKPHGRPPDHDLAHDMLGIGHFCLHAKDIQATFEKLLAAGATSTLEPTQSPNPNFVIAYLADPEGNLIELIAESASSS